MTNQTSTDFSNSMVSFLTDYLPHQRGLSNNTVISYRDTFKLFLRFLSDEKEYDLKNFRLKNLSRTLVIEFLSDYRKKGASQSAANQRLAALKSFCEYASVEYPDCLSELLAIRNIKSRKEPGRLISFLTPEQTSSLINAPDSRMRTGLRHRVILTLLYDSGCRVQELCDLKVEDVFLGGETSTVRLHGKGDKRRTVFLSKQTAALLEIYKSRFLQRSLALDPFLKNRHGQKLNRSGVGYVVQKYATQINLKDGTFPAKVHCHMLRHSKAMHMLQAGVNIVYIRDFLGHDDVATTMVYARADNRIKAEVIGKLAPQLVKEESRESWKDNLSLMNFLNDLK